MDSKQFNRERSNGIAQGREDSRWKDERIAELEAERQELQEILQRVVDEAAHLAGWSLNLERDILSKIDASRT